MTRIVQKLGVLLLSSSALVVPADQARTVVRSDWTQWRGGGRDAAILGAADPRAWPEKLTRRWQTEIGLGYATPLVVGERVYVFSRQGADEVMSAVDASTGTVVWKTAYAAPFTMHPAATRHGPGPKSTPVYADSRLFTIGMSGIVTAFDATKGGILWQKPAGTVAPMYNTHAFSPVVEQGTVIFHVGGHDQGAVTAFDLATGDVKWSWAGDGPSYGSPIVVDFEGARQLIALTQKKLIGLDAARGTLLWERPFVSARSVNAATPVSHGQIVIVSNGGPASAFRVLRRNGEWTTEVAWENPETPYTFSNALADRGLLMGLSSRNAGQYFGLDAATGRTLWLSEPRQAGNAAIVRVGDVLLSLEDDGELVVARGTETAFEIIRRYQVAETATWTVPVVSGDRLFVKDESSLFAWNLK